MGFKFPLSPLKVFGDAWLLDGGLRDSGCKSGFADCGPLLNSWKQQLRGWKYTAYKIMF